MAHSDAATITGKSHRVNQDYARAACNHMPFVLVSDGCSSSADTDFGARLLVKSAENVIRVSFGENWHDRAIHNAQKAASFINLDTTCLDATLLSLVFNGVTYDSVTASLFGDGAVVTKYKDGSLAVLLVNYPSGYPQYLSYDLDEARLQALYSVIGGSNRRLLEHCLINSDGSTGQLPDGMKCSEDAKEAMTAANIPLSKGENAEVECIAVFTDGVQSFVRKDEDGILQPVPYIDVIKRMMGVKIYKGEFMQRQMNGFVKEFAKNGWYNVDDFTVGAIYVGE
jgi:hypothetical protein